MRLEFDSDFPDEDEADLYYIKGRCELSANHNSDFLGRSRGSGLPRFCPFAPHGGSTVFAIAPEKSFGRVVWSLMRVRSGMNMNDAPHATAPPRRAQGNSPPRVQCREREVIESKRYFKTLRPIETKICDCVSARQGSPALNRRQCQKFTVNDPEIWKGRTDVTPSFAIVLQETRAILTGVRFITVPCGRHVVSMITRNRLAESRYVPFSAINSNHRPSHTVLFCRGLTSVHIPQGSLARTGISFIKGACTSCGAGLASSFRAHAAFPIVPCERRSCLLASRMLCEAKEILILRPRPALLLPHRNARISSGDRSGSFRLWPKQVADGHSK